MNLLVYFVFLSVLSCTFAQPEPRKCCMAEQYEISQESIGSLRRRDREESVLETTRISVDYSRQLKGMKGSADYLNGTRVEYRAVANYREKVMWIIKRDDCTKYALNETLRQCVPENAKFIRTAYVGATDLHINTWHVARRDEAMMGVEVMSYSYDHCIPVSTSFEGTRVNMYDGVRENASYTGLHFDFQEGIRNPEEVFTLPNNCRR